VCCSISVIQTIKRSTYTITKTRLSGTHEFILSWHKQIKNKPWNPVAGKKSNKTRSMHQELTSWGIVSLSRNPDFGTAFFPARPSSFGRSWSGLGKIAWRSISWSDVAAAASARHNRWQLRALEDRSCFAPASCWKIDKNFYFKLTLMHCLLGTAHWNFLSMVFTRWWRVYFKA